MGSNDSSNRPTEGGGPSASAPKGIEPPWLDAIVRLSGAREVVMWNADKVVATPQWPVPAPAVSALRAALSGERDMLALPADDERIAPIAGGCPLSEANFVYVPGQASSMLLGATPTDTLCADLPALARLADSKLAPWHDDEWLLATARLATAGRLAHSVAHDIGTPLNVISGYAEYLLMNTGLDDPSRAGISTMLEQTRRIAQMIRRMLDVARTTDGRSSQRQPLELFLKDVLQLSSYALRKVGVRAAQEEVETPDVDVVGDLPVLSQGVSNILLHAARLVGSGGRLTVRRSEGSSFEIDVLDASGAAHYISRFESGDANSFLEMFLATYVLREHGGSVELADTPGRLIVRLGE